MRNDLSYGLFNTEFIHKTPVDNFAVDQDMTSFQEVIYSEFRSLFPCYYCMPGRAVFHRIYIRFSMVWSMCRNHNFCSFITVTKLLNMWVSAYIADQLNLLYVFENFFMSQKFCIIFREKSVKHLFKFQKRLKLFDF